MNENFQNALALARQQLETVKKRRDELEQEENALSIELGKLQRVINALSTQLRIKLPAQQSKGEQV